MSLSLPKTAEIAILATTGSVLYVGKTSAERGRITFTTDDVLTRTVDITRIQVPPRAPKRQPKGCLFFVSTSLPKPLKPLGFQLIRNPGAFLFVVRNPYVFASIPTCFRRLRRRPDGGTCSKCGYGWQ